MTSPEQKIEANEKYFLQQNLNKQLDATDKILLQNIPDHLNIKFTVEEMEVHNPPRPPYPEHLNPENFNEKDIKFSYVYGWNLEHHCIKLNIIAKYQPKGRDVIRTHMRSISLDQQIVNVKTQLTREIKEKYQNEGLKEDFNDKDYLNQDLITWDYLD